jgi:hypothetical protein
MQEGAGVGRKKSDARIPSVQRGLSASATLPVLNGFDQDPADIRRCFLAFLPGSGLQVECDVTYSKQTTEPFLPGSRIATKRLVSRTIFHSVSSELFLTRRRISLQDGIAHLKPVAGSPRMHALVGRP